MNAFDQRKQNISTNFCDHSLKGSIDEGVLTICNLLNSHHDYYTTSSCSGRIVLFNENQQKQQKEELSNPWLLISHCGIEFSDFINALNTNRPNDSSLISLKFEPMVMHVEARDIDHAQKLLSIAVQSGFRNSGISISPRRYIVAVRCTLKLEVPIIYDGNNNLILNEEYLQKLVHISNEKMMLNNGLIDRFYNNLQLQL